MEIICNNIKLAREQRRFTQQHMASVLEVSQSTYSRIESGLVDLRLSTLRQIATAVNVPLALLISTDQDAVRRHIRARRAVRVLVAA